MLKKILGAQSERDTRSVKIFRKSLDNSLECPSMFWVTDSQGCNTRAGQFALLTNPLALVYGLGGPRHSNRYGPCSI